MLFSTITIGVTGSTVPVISSKRAETLPTCGRGPLTFAGRCDTGPGVTPGPESCLLVQPNGDHDHDHDLFGPRAYLL